MRSTPCLAACTSLLFDGWQHSSLKDLACLAPTQLVKWPLLNRDGIEVAVKREDLLDPKLSGNKFYKLHGHIKKFNQNHSELLATFGGAYSNHIYATAAVGQQLNIGTVGVIRGERASQLSPTLIDASAMGMKLVFVSRSEYRNKNDPGWLKAIEQRIGSSVYWVPEGGGDLTGSEGCAEWARQSILGAPWLPTHVCLASGTGGTAAGVLAGSGDVPVHAFMALKGSTAEVEQFSHKVVGMAQTIRCKAFSCNQPLAPLYLETGYHYGGYAKFPSELQGFMQQLEQDIEVPLDPVYTAKLFAGVAQKAKEGFWPKGSKLLLLHTGGLQGRRGFSLG